VSSEPIARWRRRESRRRVDPADLVMVGSLCLVVFACFFLVGRAASPQARGGVAAPVTVATPVASVPMTFGTSPPPSLARAAGEAAPHGARRPSGRTGGATLVAAVPGPQAGLPQAAAPRRARTPVAPLAGAPVPAPSSEAPPAPAPGGTRAAHREQSATFDSSG
jgi:hypothetical protein